MKEDALKEIFLQVRRFVRCLPDGVCGIGAVYLGGGGAHFNIKAVRDHNDDEINKLLQTQRLFFKSKVTLYMHDLPCISLALFF